MKMFHTISTLTPIIFWALAYSVSSTANSNIAESDRNSSPKIWALLVAGSSGFGNYRHQADICHAYHVLINNGIPPENIIVMMYDDIAHNPENPTPGIIINEPNGTDVYEGVVKDYTRKEVTPENFLNILSGNKSAMNGIGSERVIESGPKDYVFVNFVDHGGPGILGFPDGVLAAQELIYTLEQMAAEKKFRKMILYIEACFSGSMFDVILNDTLNIFVMTAADTSESSYACYYDDLRGTYLGDVFSVNWMAEAEREALSTYSLNHLFEKVRHNTSTSHVEEYGDLDIGNTILSEVIGTPMTGRKDHTIRQNPNLDAVPQPEVPLRILRKKFKKAIMEADANKKKIKKLKRQIKELEEKQNIHSENIRNIVRKSSQQDNLETGNVRSMDILESFKMNTETLSCYKTAIKEYSKNCLNINEHSFILPSLKHFENACNSNLTNVDAIVEAIRSSCGAK